MNKKNIFLFLMIINVIALFAIDSVATTLITKGDVELNRNNIIYQVSPGDALFNDDEISCRENSYAAIKFTDNSSVVKIFPQSVLLIHSEKKSNGNTEKSNLLKIGEVWAKVTPNTGAFEIVTPTTVASVKGTGFLLSVDENGVTDLYTVDGSVEFKNRFDGITTTVSAGNKGTSNGQGQIIVEPFSMSDLPKDIRRFMEKEIDEPKQNNQNGSSGQNMNRPTAPDIEIPQDDTEESSDNGTFGLAPLSMGGGIGTVSEGDNFYTQVRLMPELRFGKFGLGFDIELMIDSEGKVRDEDWDEWEDYVNKLYYLRYGHRGDKIYGQIGAIPSYTLGQGLIMKNYTNMLHYPDTKQIGLQLGGQITEMDMQAEIFTSNVTKNEILAGRFSLVPLKESQIPILNNLRFGASVGVDRNPYGKLEDSDNDNYYDVFDAFPDDDNYHSDTDNDNIPDQLDIDLDGDNIIDSEDYWLEIYTEINQDSTGFDNWYANTDLKDDDVIEIVNPIYDENLVAVLGIDYNLPLFSNKVFSIGHYAEVAKFTDSDSDKGAGFIFPGFYSKFLIFQANLEYRQYQDEFIPGFFDKLYDDQRAVAYTSPENHVVTKFDKLNEYRASQGWYGSLTSNIFKILYLTIAYEDMYSDVDSNRSIWGNISLEKSMIPKLNRAEIRYMQKDFKQISKLHFKGENAHIDGVVGYNLSPNTELVLNYSVQYLDVNNNGIIKGEDETITSMSMGVEFRF